MKYKPVLLTEQAYKELNAVRRTISKKSAKTATFSEAVEELAGRKSLLLDVDQDLVAYITEFVSLFNRHDGVEGIVLFGSIAKGTSTKYSDIDLFIIVKGSVGRYYDLAHADIMSLGNRRQALVNRGIFNYLSPTIVNTDDLNEFKPLYLDIADYGITLLDSEGIVAGFMERMRDIPHRREQTIYGEVLKWKIKE